MKTIIYVGGFELPDKNAAAQRVLNNSRIFLTLGYRVVLLGVSRERSYDHVVHAAECCEVDVAAFQIGYPKSRGDWFEYIKSDWPVRALIEEKIVTTDSLAAVICYNYPALAQWAIASTVRKWGAAVISDCTEWYGARPWNSVANAVKNIDIPLRMHGTNRLMDGIITTSPFMTHFYRKSGLPIVEIPTLMDQPLPPSGECTIQTPLLLVALASGINENAKAEDIHDRIDWILELLGVAAAAGASFKLQVVGASLEQYLRVFPGHGELIVRLGSRVEFFGRIPRKDVLRLLQSAAFSIVFRHETRVTLAGFPSKYSESITNGVPCIVNSIPSLQGYHAEGKTGFTIDPADSVKAVEKLCRILRTSHQEILDMKRHCRQCAVFTAQAFESKVLNFLSAVREDQTICRSIG